MAREWSNGTKGNGLPGRVPKYKRSTPQGLKIQRHKTSKRPFRGFPKRFSGSRLSSGDEAENVSDNSNAEIFAQMAALMAMLGDEINDYGSAIHSELQRQIEEKNFHDVSQTIAQHLDTLRWSTPQTSPALTNSSAGTPSSASSETKRNRLIERYLRNKEFHYLLENDHEFHKFMRDLTGLREWWSANRAEWQQRRDGILELEETLKALALQMDKVNSQKIQRLQLQFKLQMDEMTSQLDWFPKNERLQKKVKAQFKSIAAKTAKLEGRISPLRIVKEWQGAGGFEFNTEPDWADITNAPWWYEYGFTWWLSNIGADHVQYCLDKIKSQRETLRTRLEDCETTIILTKCEISEMERGGTASDETREQNIAEFRGMVQSWLDIEDIETTYRNDELDAKILKRNGEIAAQRQVLSEKRDLLIVSNEEKYRLEFEVLDLQRRQERDCALLALVKKILGLGSINDLTSLFAERFFFVLAFQHRYECIHNNLSKLQQSTEFLRSDKIKLLGMLQDHYEFHGSHHQELISTVQETINKMNNREDFGTDWADVLHFNMKEQLESILDIDGRTADFKERKREILVAPRAVDLGEVSCINRPFHKVSLIWNQITTIEEAVQELEEVMINMSGEKQHTLTALRDFFVSPDVAPTFEQIRNTSKQDFAMLVNSFLVIKLFPRQIEAFLMYCHHVGDLFTLTVNNKVSAYTQGWEVVVEMPIRGPARRIQLIKPQGINELEIWLASGEIGFNDQHLRLFSEDELISSIKGSYAPAAQVNSVVAKGYLAYFHQAGRFYK
jgi:hypothetical protein